MLVLKSKKVSPGLLECALNLAALYPDQLTRAAFEDRWQRFAASNDESAALYRKENDRLFYLSEAFVPEKSDNRAPVLFVAGNPACHSVAEGLCFSREAGVRVHRFWRALRSAGVAEFNCDTKAAHPLELNELRKKKLYALEYQSPFRIGITTFFSFPTPASAPPWSGVSGLVRLFGRTAVQHLLIEEQTRLRSLLDPFMAPPGAIVALQRDAYEGLAASDSPRYSLRAALAGTLRGTSKFFEKVPVFGVPPTRYWQSPTCIALLRRIRDCVSG